MEAGTGICTWGCGWLGASDLKGSWLMGNCVKFRLQSHSSKMWNTHSTPRRMPCPEQLRSKQITKESQLYLKLLTGAVLDRGPWQAASVGCFAVQALSCVQLSATPWTAAHQAAVFIIPVFHHLLEFAQTHVHWGSAAIQPSHPRLSPSPPAFDLSQHQGLFQWVIASYVRQIE